MIAFKCPNCHVPLKIASEKAGYKAKCPKCQASLVIPQAPMSQAKVPAPAAHPTSPEQKAAEQTAVQDSLCAFCREHPGWARDGLVISLFRAVTKESAKALPRCTACEGEIQLQGDRKRFQELCRHCGKPTEVGRYARVTPLTKQAAAKGKFKDKCIVGPPMCSECWALRVVWDKIFGLFFVGGWIVGLTAGIALDVWLYNTSTPVDRSRGVLFPLVMVAAVASAVGGFLGAGVATLVRPRKLSLRWAAKRFVAVQQLLKAGWRIG